MAEGRVMAWPADGPDVLMGMRRETVQEFGSVADYAASHGRFLDRLGYPDGKYFYQLPEQGPWPYEARSLDPLSVNWPYYQYELVALPDALRLRTGIVLPWFGLPGGARCVQVVWGNIPLTAAECIEMGILRGKGA